MTIYLQRIQKIRTLMRERFGVQGVLIPRADVYQSEYVVEADERLYWLTGFTGSAGFVLILEETAALFVDGRYILQAQQEVDPDLFTVYHYPDVSPKTILQKAFKQGDKVGYDPWLTTKTDYDRWHKILTDIQGEFLPLGENPVDVLWQDRPARPLTPIQIHMEMYTGQSVQEKIEKVQGILREQNRDLFICNAPESICWLLNIRAEDFPFTPMVDGFAFIPQIGKCDLFVDSRKVSSQVKLALDKYVTFREYGSFCDAISKIEPGQSILLDSGRSPLWIAHHLKESSLHWGIDPCSLLKAVKNPIEMEGMRQAHVKDGVAVTKFLAWLSKALQENESLDELKIVDQLEFYRQEQKGYRGPSFATIAGFASNGAIIHYRPTLHTNKIIEGDGLLLLDSGGQYWEGTTDITRTLLIGMPDQEQKDRFTRVLKGHIALATAIFPAGTTGSQLDSFARQPLWQVGLDYNHGTGHGVGCYLSVHEGPQRISKMPSHVGLLAGMVLSNEPGYYKTNHYGIRIENLILTQVSEPQEDHELPLFQFETLTMVAIDTRLIAPELLTTGERQWLNDYHLRVREALLPHLDTETAAWLIEATQEI